MRYSSGVYFRFIFLSICQLKILLLFSLFSKFLSEKFLSKGIFFKIKFKFLKYHKVMHIHLSNKVLNTVMQKQSIVRIFILLWFLFFDNIHITPSLGTNTNINQHPIDKICRQINCCKYLLQMLKMKNTIIFTRECLMCAIARFSYSNSEFFLNFLFNTH